jgi:hypothetical protein
MRSYPVNLDQSGRAPRGSPVLTSVRSRAIACALLLGAALTLVPASRAQAQGEPPSAARGAVGGSGGPLVPQRPGKAPNILFVIMDDVGIDQMEVFGYGGDTPPSTPTIAQVADAGVRFHNAWSMPACSTSRGVFFEGRFPFRTNLLGALGPSDLANSMVSPYEMTTPKLLRPRGYESALFGKFHIALPGNDPDGLGLVHERGWDYFSGWLDETGDPSSIDVTAGGVAKDGKTYSCGFVPSAAAGGADFGACYQPDGSCRELSKQGLAPPGRICLAQGGILDPNESCRVPAPDYLDFQTLSGHYVNPVTYNFPNGAVVDLPPTDSRARTFRAVFAVDEAISWINSRPDERPWMATVSFASDHTPLMQPPVDERIPGSAAASDLDCTNSIAQRLISNLMIESLDLELGRLLVETGLAQRGPDGEIVYRPRRTDTMVIVVGDNGSLGGTVKLPFDGSRAKGTAYQTGVWVPLVVAGPLVKGPARSVNHMVNIADLYALFGEIAGIKDVRRAVPRPIDSEPFLPYLLNPDQGPIRKWNFTQVGPNLQANFAINAPCTISSSCTQIPVTKSVCEDNNGTWWGEGHDAPETEGIPPEGFQYCCQVNEFICQEPDCVPFTLQPLNSLGIRNKRYKIVQNTSKLYVSQAEPCVDTTTTEFYEINEAVPIPKIDKEGTGLSLDALTPVQQRNFDALSAQLSEILTSEPDCPGDGNIDLVVDAEDLEDWRFYEQSTGLSSVYDLNIDGLTNEEDEAIIQEHLGLDCRTQLLP